MATTEEVLDSIAGMTLFADLTSPQGRDRALDEVVPVLGAMATAIGLNPAVLILACTIGASSAFMMPVGTPPNAIVFGTGLVRMPQMMKAGIWLNLAAIAIITALGWFYFTPLLGSPY